MENSPSIETVLQALQALYHNADTTGKEKASVWLGELQKSMFAWQIADQLLRLNKDLESCYFAAQTMRTKIQYAFHELDASSHQSLRDSLLNHVTKLTQDTPHVIVTQLCLALADLALQMAAWKGAVNDLLQRFATDASHVQFLLEVLVVLPEELNSRCLRLGANRRSEVLEELRLSAPHVLRLLDACSTNLQSSTALQTKIFRCLGSWFSVSVIPDDILVGTDQLNRPFQALLDPQCPSMLHEAAADCICSALYSTTDVTKHQSFVEALLQGALRLTDSYHMSVATEDIDKSINFTRVFTEFAETLLNNMVTTPNQGLGDFTVLEMVLTCVGHHQYEVAEITFNFWYRLSEELYQKNNDDLSKCFKPYIQRLIIALCRHCQMDPDHEGVPTESDDFGDFRIKVSELVKDTVFLVGSSSVFSHMFLNLSSQPESTSWDASEASLFIMSAVAKNILPDENTIVPQVVPAILSLPDSAHVALRFTSIQLIGELAEWIDEHHQYLEPVLQFLLLGLQQPPLASVAANSLQNICTTCRDKMTSHLQGLINIVKAIDSFNVSSEAAIGLLKGTAMVLAQLPPGDLTSGLTQLCSIQVDALSKVLSTPVNGESRTKLDPIIWLDRLAAIFRHTNPKITNGQHHPCQSVIHELWPVLSEACNKYQGDVRVVERYCRCVRFAVRCVGKASHSLLTPLVTQMVTLYQSHQHSCFLYLGSILVDEYGGEEGCTEGLLGMLEAFSHPTFKLFEQQNGMRLHPDTVDDFFRLSLRCTQRLPVPFLQCPLCKAILCCAIAAVSLDHRDANASVTKFLVEFLKCASSKNEVEDYKVRRELVTSLLSTQGPELVSAIVNACILSLPTYMLADMAEVIQELKLLDTQTMSVWLESTLSSLPSTNNRGFVTATSQQLQDFHRAVTSTDDHKTITAALRDFARLYR